MNVSFYSNGTFIKLPDSHSASSMLAKLNFTDCNIIILESRILKNRLTYSFFIYNLNNYFSPINQNSPRPFVVISDEGKDELFNHFNSIIFNSSIWFWYIYIGDLHDGLGIQSKLINDGIAFNNYNYKTSNAIEFIDFNLRLQSQNYLNNLESGHGRNITPQIYSDEFQKREETKISDDLAPFLNVKLEGGKAIVRVNLRVLLIDDKVGQETCKAELIKKLLELKFDAAKMTDVCWLTDKNKDETVETKIYFTSENIISLKNEVLKSICSGITNTLLCDLLNKMIHTYDNQKFISIKSENLINSCISIINKLSNLCDSEIIANVMKEIESIQPSFTNKFELRIEANGLLTKGINIENGSKKIQLIAVKSIEIAQKMLADDNLRFDLIMMDYLLDNKPKREGKVNEEREYATEFWGNGIEKFFELSTKAKKDPNYKEIKETYDKIKSNRGPMHKLWIFPITAFNQTFIDDLRNKGIRLIDYYWYLSRGADPINTPYLFINSLNKFLQLQLENAIFSQEEISGFLRKSLNNIKTIKTFDEFNAYMGAEYTVFVEKYMTRPVIYKDMKAGSLFAKYVWDNFYSNENYLNLFKLTNHIHKFYHRCAFGTKADFEKMVLFWREMKIYIDEQLSGEIQDLRLEEFYNILIEIEPR